MAKLPISRVVDVSISRKDRFATRRGFGVPLLLTTTAVNGEVDATVRTKLYGSIDEVAVDWASSSSVYKAATAVFAQSPRLRQIKVGYIAPGVVADPSTADFDDQLDLVLAYDDDWYWVVPCSEFRDKVAQLELAMAWIEARNRIMLVDSNASGHENPANTSVLAAANKGEFERTAVFYHSDTTAQLAAAAVGYLARRDFDTADSAYTAKFKRLTGQPVLNKSSSIVQAITGFVPGLGLSTTEGHLANTYVDIGGLPMLVEGNTLSGAFIDEIHAGDWLVARSEEELLSTLTNNDVVPYTNPGQQLLVAAVEGVMERAAIAGLIATYTDPETGEELPAYQIRTERVEDIPASQRRNRVGPAIDATFRYAGAIHYTTARITMTF